jgi:hypothetical protein
MSVTKAVLTDPSHTIAEMATNLGKSRATIMGMASMQMLPLEKWHVDTKKDALAAPLCQDWDHPRSSENYCIVLLGTAMTTAQLQVAATSFVVREP